MNVHDALRVCMTRSDIAVVCVENEEHAHRNMTMRGLPSVCGSLLGNNVYYVVGGRVGMGVTHYIVP